MECRWDVACRVSAPSIPACTLYGSRWARTGMVAEWGVLRGIIYDLGLAEPD